MTTSGLHAPMRSNQLMFPTIAGLWLVTAAAFIAADYSGTRWDMSWPIRLYLGATLIASAVCFALYASDKQRAQRQRRRVPERTLHLWSLLGGWPGAALGSHVFRHKTQKVSYRIVFGLILLSHAVVIGFYLWWS